MRFPIAAVFLVPLSVVAACDLFPSDLTTIDLPVPISSPAVDVDVGTPVDSAIDSACATPDAASCLGIAALCEAEEGAPCVPPTLPDQFPQEITFDGETTSAEDVLPDAVKEATLIKLAIPVDLTDLLEAGGVTSSDQVKDITIKQLGINWEANSLTFNAPALDVYVGPKVDDVTDPDSLVTAEGFARIGTIGVDVDEAASGFEAGQLAETTGVVPLTFIEGGNAAFNEQLKTFAFTLVLVAPDGQALTLSEVDGDSSKVRKPDGAASLKLEGELSYSVDLAEAAGITD
jgi:hypothetical protein